MPGQSREISMRLAGNRPLTQTSALGRRAPMGPRVATAEGSRSGALRSAAAQSPRAVNSSHSAAHSRARWRQVERQVERAPISAAAAWLNGLQHTGPPPLSITPIMRDIPPQRAAAHGHCAGTL